MNKGGVLRNDEDFVKFRKLLDKAIEEGRIDGKHRCSMCGMRYNAENESQVCCTSVARSA